MAMFVCRNKSLIKNTPSPLAYPQQGLTVKNLKKMKKALLALALLASINAGAATIADSTAPQRHELPKASDLGNKHFWQDKGPECNDAVARERRRVISNTVGLLFLAGLVAVIITAIAQSQKAAAGK